MCRLSRTFAAVAVLTLTDSQTGLTRPPQGEALPLQEQVDLRLPEHDMTGLRRDEKVLHRMGGGHARLNPDDRRRAFERMGGAHARLELVGPPGFLLEHQQTGGQRFGLALRLKAKQIVHRQLAEVPGDHPIARFIAWMTT